MEKHMKAIQNRTRTTAEQQKKLVSEQVGALKQIFNCCLPIRREESSTVAGDTGDRLLATVKGRKLV